MARSQGRRGFGTILFFLALVATLGFLFILFADSRGITEVPGVGEIPTAALVLVIGLVVVALALFVLILLRPWSRTAEDLFVGDALIQFVDADAPTYADEPERRSPAPPLRGGIVPVDLAGVPIGARAWGPSEGSGAQTIHPFHFPRMARRAVYANDYIAIGGGRRLRLRTLLAAPAGAFRGAVEERPAPAKVRPAERRNPDAFMAKLEERYEEETAAKRPEDYYDYAGDVHDVIDVEGIGPVYAEKLKAAGIETTARLCYEDAGTVAKIAGAPRKAVESWQAMAELMKVTGIGKQYAEALARAGISGIAELKKRSAQVIADQINEYLDGLESNVLGTSITSRRVDGWKAAAAGMRRVRMQIPEA